jgi:aminoglycoside phosphotransferase (APT) family kinase protein
MPHRGDVREAAGSLPLAGPGGQDSQQVILQALRRLGLLGAGEDAPLLTPLTGGVSSDIWRVELPAGAVCVKRALPRLKVAQVWEAPVERNRYEQAYLRAAAAIVPGAVPRLLADDPDSGLFVMDYLDPALHPVWKQRLREGHADAAFAARVGSAVGAIHAATADRPEVAAAFATDTIFHAIRLEPYLLATARVHADLAPRLRALVQVTAQTRRVLVHGDVSPKNILVGPAGPVLLDAECAWFGDPAFDLAFCLNHLLLKCAWVPAARAGYLACFDALAAAYLARVSWEEPALLEARAAALLPGLFLARVDGKSPVEYLTDEAWKQRVRDVARALLAQPVPRLQQVAQAWRLACDAAAGSVPT